MNTLSIASVVAVLTSSAALAQDTSLMRVFPDTVEAPRMTWDSGVKVDDIETYRSFRAQGDFGILNAGELEVEAGTGGMISKAQDPVFEAAAAPVRVASRQVSLVAARWIVDAVLTRTPVFALCDDAGGVLDMSMDDVRMIAAGPTGNFLAEADRLSLQASIITTPSGCSLEARLAVTGLMIALPSGAGLQTAAGTIDLTMPGDIAMLEAPSGRDMTISGRFEEFTPRVPGGASAATFARLNVDQEIDAATLAPLLTALLRSSRAENAPLTGRDALSALTAIDTTLSVSAEGAAISTANALPVRYTQRLSDANLSTILGNMGWGLEIAEGRLSLDARADFTGVSRSRIAAEARIPRDFHAPADVAPVSVEVHHVDRGLLRNFEFVHGADMSVFLARLQREGLSGIPEAARGDAREALTDLARFFMVSTAETGTVLRADQTETLSIRDIATLARSRPDVLDDLFEITIEPGRMDREGSAPSAGEGP